MSWPPPPECEKCGRYPNKVFCVLFDESVIEVCSRCRRQIAKEKKNAKRRDLPGPLLFQFMDET